MGNEIYSEENFKQHGEEALSRIHKDLDFLLLYKIQGRSADVCCGNCVVGDYIGAEYYYDKYPACDKVISIDLAVLNSNDVSKIIPVENVFMMHALEHFSNPTDVLDKLHSHFIKPNGRLFLAVPNSFYKDDENSYKPFNKDIGHLYQFTIPTLRLCLEQANFKIHSLIQVHHKPNFYELLVVATA